MTKQHSKFTNAIAIATCFALLAPSLAFAQTDGGTTRGTNIRAAISDRFCTKIEEVATRVNGGINDRVGRYTTKRDELKSKITERQGARDTQRAENRDGWDNKRGEWLAKLTARASTTEQKAAVGKFITAIDSAVAVRRSAVDGAVKDYRTALEGVMATRQSSVESAIATFKQDADAALVKLKSDCAANVDVKTARETYVASMKTAREKLRASIKTLESRKDTLTPLVNSRKIAVEKAVADFKVAVENATKELKASLGN